MKTEKKIIIFSILLGLFAGLIDSFIDYFAFYEKSFWDLMIFDVPTFEVYVRSILLATFTIYGIIISKVIAKRKRAEEELLESEERYRQLFNKASDPIMLFDSGTREFLDANEAATKLYGYSREEFLKLTQTDITAEPEESDKTIKQTVAGEISRIPLRYHKRKDGTIFPVEISSSTIKLGEKTVLCGMIRNITERKQAEEALRESQNFLIKAQEIARVGSWKWQSDSDEGIWSDQTFRILGYAPNEIQTTYKWLLGVMHPDDREPVMKGIEESMSTGESFDMEYRLTSKDQKEIVVHSLGEVVSNQAGDTIGMIGVIHDITKHKHAEGVLQKSRERYRALFEDNPIETIVVDKDARIKMYNRAKRTSGDRLPSIGDVMYKDYAASHLIDMHRELMECIQLGKSKDFPDQNYNGKFLDIRVFPFEEGAIITSIDRTEKKNLETKLRRIQKMESLGLMAGGIAHDLNNILSGIVSYPELILMDLPEDSPLRKPIETIKESGMRAADVVSDLLTIARGVATGKDVSSLNTIIEEYLGSAEHQELKTIHSFITFKIELDSDLLNIRCSLKHIRKSLTNLITNASEAIEGSGTVAISTMNRYLDEPLRGYEDVRRGEYAVLTVSDNGSGISTDDLERIFEPFYTKKVMGRSGTGLGLAIVWNTLQDNDGYINVNTSKKGTEFELYFPAIREKLAVEEEAIPVKDYLGHGERVLVVDDEERQREIACGILTKLGYTAEAVSSGEEAVEYLKEQSVELIVLDMIMPKGINGRETYERIIEIHPGQKAIIASGFSETSEVRKAQKLGAGKYIKKPYTMEKIGLAVKEELEK